MTIKDKSKGLSQHLFIKNGHKLIFHKKENLFKNDPLAKLYTTTQRINKLATEIKPQNKKTTENNVSSVEEIFGLKRRLSQFTYKSIDNNKNKNYRNRMILPSLEEKNVDSNGKRLSWSRPSLIKLPNLQEQINLRKIYNENLLRTRIEEKTIKKCQSKDTRLSTYIPHENLLDYERRNYLHDFKVFK
jgi:hypothetical protein